MVCGESNEINGEKKFLGFTAEKKNCLLLIRSEKNCTFKLGVQKKFDHERKNHSPPHVSSGPPLISLFYQHKITICLKMLCQFNSK